MKKIDEYTARAEDVLNLDDGHKPLERGYDAPLLTEEADTNTYKQTITEKEKQVFVHRAVCVLGIYNNKFYSDPYGWLCSMHLLGNGGTPTEDSISFRRTILAELGQIHDEDDLRAVARVINMYEPSNEDAINVIREFRRNEKPSMVAMIQERLRRCITKLQSKHTDVTDLDVLRAVEYLSNDYLENVEILPLSAVNRLIRAEHLNGKNQGDYFEHIQPENEDITF